MQWRAAAHIQQRSVALWEQTRLLLRKWATLTHVREEKPGSQNALWYSHRPKAKGKATDKTGGGDKLQQTSQSDMIHAVAVAIWYCMHNSILWQECHCKQCTRQLVSQ